MFNTQDGRKAREQTATFQLQGRTARKQNNNVSTPRAHSPQIKFRNHPDSVNKFTAHISLSIRTLLCIMLLTATACSTTKKIPEGELLYTGLKGVDYVKPDSVIIPTGLREALTEAVDMPGNKRTLLFFPAGLWAYNNLPDSASGFKGWLYRKFAQDPVLVSEIKPQLRTRMLDQILENNGYFRGSASYTLVHPKNKKKASILYTITPGKAFPIDSIILPPDTCHLNHVMDSVLRKDRYLQPGAIFALDSLSQVRTRITTALRNRGYYLFSPEYIEYLADSLQHKGQITLKVDLANNIPRFVERRYRTGRITVLARRHDGKGLPDTIELKDGIELVQMKPSRLRRSVITDNVTFRSGKYISLRDFNRTQQYLSRLGIFSAISVNALPDTTAAEPTLDVAIDCTFDMPLEASIEVNASSKSNSYIGPGVIFGVTNHNIFGGGEQLNVSLNGSYEWQTGRDRSSVFNSYEFGLSSSLAFPRLLAPKFIPRRKRQINWTRITLNADLLNRPHYFKMAQFNASFGYEWRSSRYTNNQLTLFKLTYTNLMKTTHDFDSIMDHNPAVAQSFKSQYIPQIAYTWTYDRQINRDNAINLQVTLQEAGNAFWGIYSLCGKKGEKELFGTPFSQFVKGSVQLVWNRRLGRTDQWLVGRVATGAAHAYGNSSQVPYAEQFYVGGANSIRAFTVRSIGPGSYHEAGPNSDDYFDQTGTFKFEANLEYRFPIWSVLHGALFVDSGNVWLLNNDPARPGGTLKGSSFLKDLALGTGVGLRVDIGMIVIRGDLGIGIHAPYDTGKRGYYNMTSFGNSLAFHLAIGYPF